MKRSKPLTGAPNEYFSENEPLTTENENLDAFKAFSSAFRLDGYSPSQQSGLFHVYQPAEKKYQYSNKRRRVAWKLRR